MATPAVFQLSPQQQAVLDFELNDTRSLNLVARAGCGKTSTLLALTKSIVSRASQKSIAICCYNSSIASEIGGKLGALLGSAAEWQDGANGKRIPPKATSGTIHSFAFSAWRKAAPAVKVDDTKLAKIVDAYLLTRAEELDANPVLKAQIEQRATAAIKAVGLAKQRAFGVLCAVDDKAKWYDLIDHFGLDEDMPEESDTEPLIKFAIWLYRRSLESCREVIDFNDMILAPLYFKAFVWTYDIVMLDEAQDTNPARRAFAKRMLKPRTGRLIAVGDPAQAIYGFTGADSDSMDIIARELGSATLPLNVTYRCPKAVVRLAQQWVPDITADASAPEGTVRSTKLNPAPDSKEPGFWAEALTKDDIVLCRNTAPIVEMAYTLLRKGIACQVEGREIAGGLIKIIRRWKVVNLLALDKAVNAWMEKEVSAYLAKGKEEKAERLADQCKTILVLSGKMQEEGKKTVEDLVAFVNSMFGAFDRDPKVKPEVLTLCTIHKSKGREWRRVYLLGRAKYQPSKYARKDWQVEQEMNLCYVAVTRAQSELVEVVV